MYIVNQPISVGNTTPLHAIPSSKIPVHKFHGAQIFHSLCHIQTHPHQNEQAGSLEKNKEIYISALLVSFPRERAKTSNLGMGMFAPHTAHLQTQ